jgi:hypothetical protein
MWWTVAGMLPTPDEAKTRLDYIRKYGETEFAFTFRSVFPRPAGTTRAQQA